MIDYRIVKPWKLFSLILVTMLSFLFVLELLSKYVGKVVFSFISDNGSIGYEHVFMILLTTLVLEILYRAPIIHWLWSISPDLGHRSGWDGLRLSKLIRALSVFSLFEPVGKTLLILVLLKSNYVPMKTGVPAFIILLALYLSNCVVIFCFPYLISKLLISAEKRARSKLLFVVTYFQFLFFPIGVWWFQKRIRNLFTASETV